MPVEAVRIHVEDDVRLPRRLEAVLKEKIDGYTGTVMNGKLKPELYYELTGKVAGLREALQLAQTLAKELAEG